MNGTKRYPNTTCEMCGTAFYARPYDKRKGHGRFCSLRCFRASPIKPAYGSRKDANQKSPNRTCEVCGKPFYSTPYNVAHSGGKYCSQACYSASGVRNSNANVGPAIVARLAKPRRRMRRACETCGNTFDVYPSMVKSYDCCRRKEGARYCSTKCANNARDRYFVTCKWCGDEYEVRQSRLPKTNYCSKKCKADAERKHNLTQFSIEDRSRLRTIAWVAQRDAILERDSYTCQHCSSQAHNLIVHHIIPWRDTRDDSQGNLVTLCRSCHAVIHFPNGKPSLFRHT